MATEFSLKGAVVAIDRAGNRAGLGTRDGRVCIAELATGRRLIDRPGAHPFAVGVLGWSDDSSQLASWGVVDTSFHCWEVAVPPVTEVRISPNVRHFTLSADGKWLAAADAQEPRIRVFDRTSEAAPRELWGSDPSAPGILVFSPDSRQLAEVNAYRAVVWDVQTEQLLVRLEQASGLEGLITSVAFSPTGSLLASVSSARDPRVAVWDVLRCREVWRAPPDSLLHTAYLAPGGCLLAGISQPSLASPPQMIALELTMGRVVAQAELPGVPIDWNSFSPDGKWLATLHPSGGENTVAFFASAGTVTHTEIVLHRFPENSRQVVIPGLAPPSATAFSPESRLLTIGYRDGSIRLCCVDSGEEIFHCRLQSRPIIQIAFSGDGATLAVTSGSDSVQLLDLPKVRRPLMLIGLDW